MDSARFNVIRGQLALYELLHPEVADETLLVGVDLLVLVDAFRDCRKLLREVVDAAQADNGPAAPLDPRRDPLQAGAEDHGGEFAPPSYSPAPASAIPFTLADRREAERRGEFTSADQASVIETMAEAVSQLAETIRELGSQCAELARK